MNIFNLCYYGKESRDRMKKEKSCGAIIVNNENKILVIKHKQGHWAFPKGHTEDNETELETALREVKEETNLDITIDKSIREVITYSPKEGVLKDVVYFLGKSKEENVILQESEVVDYLWLSYEECQERLTYQNDKDILKNIFLKK